MFLLISFKASFEGFHERMRNHLHELANEVPCMTSSLAFMTSLDFLRESIAVVKLYGTVRLQCTGVSLTLC